MRGEFLEIEQSGVDDGIDKDNTLVALDDTKRDNSYFAMTARSLAADMDDAPLFQKWVEENKKLAVD